MNPVHGKLLRCSECDYTTYERAELIEHNDLSHYVRLDTHCKDCGHPAGNMMY